MKEYSKATNQSGVERKKAKTDPFTKSSWRDHRLVLVASLVITVDTRLLHVHRDCDRVRLTPDYLIDWLTYAYASICPSSRVLSCPGHTIAVCAQCLHVENRFLIYPAALTVFSPDGHLFQVCSFLTSLDSASHAS